MTKPQSVLVVEDDPGVHGLLKALAERHCPTVDVATDGEMAIEMLQRRAYDVVILDLMLPKANGLAVGNVIGELETRPKLVVLSAISRYFGDRFPEGTLVLQKPFEIDEIEAVFREE